MNTCCFVSFAYILGIVNALGGPFLDELMFEQGDDTALVESTVRETRAVGPKDIGDLLSPGVKDAFLHTYGDKEGQKGDEIGYSKKVNDKGSDGYEHVDGFHKKDSDKYGYEIHSEFGKQNKAGVDIDKKKKQKSKNHDDKDDDEGEGQETKTNYEVVEGTKDAEAKFKQSVDDFDDKFYGKNDGDSDVKGAASEDDETEASYNEDEDSEEPAESSYSYSKGGNGGGSYKSSDGGEEKGDGGHSTSYSKGGSYSSSSGKSHKGGTGSGSGNGYSSGSGKGYGGESESYQSEEDF
ncbi:unnamed protein product [Callosobruchus maculatus]|uniref:Uncharacterized protein n=1 Tax=Callosobruchus maculatus TaxID=64391 RepID=A0A653DFH3_CALMS|nr:unnamed protein product [Callosobruchus maculatus]